MFRATLRSLFARKRRLLTTSVAVLLGVAFMAGTMVLTDTISRSFNDLFNNVFAGTDAFVRSASKVETRGNSTRARIDASLVPVVARVPGVEHADGFVQGYTQIVGRNGKAMGNPDMGAPTFGTNWSDDAKLNPFHVVEGRPPRADDEVVIDKASATKGKLAVGDSTRVLFQGPSQTVRIVGIARFGTADSPLGASFAMFTTAAAQRWVGQPGTFDAIQVTGARGVSQPALRAAIARALPDGVEVLTGKEVTKEQQDEIQRGLRFFSTFMLVFAAISLFVGSFIIHNTFSILVAQRGRELALFRAIGASRRQVLGSVMLEAVGVGAVASVFGLAFGIGVAVLLKALLDVLGFGIPATGLIVTPSTVVAAVVVGVVVSVVSAYTPARRAARVPPVAAMRDLAVESTAGLGRRIIVGAGVVAGGLAALLYGLYGPLQNRVAPDGAGVAMIFVGVALLGPVIAGPVSRVLGAPLARYRGVPGALARENALRNPRRTSATAAALMIGVGLIGFVMIFAASTKASFGNAISQRFIGDFVVSSTTTGFGGLSPDIEPRIAQVRDVAAISPVRLSPIEVEKQHAFVAAVDRTTFGDIVNIGVRSGSMQALGPGTIAVRDVTARHHHWRVGTTINARFAKGGPQPLKIAATFHRGVVARNYIVGLETYRASAGDQFDVMVIVKLANGARPSAAREALENATADYPTAKVLDETEFIRSQTNQVNTLLGLIYVLLFLAVVIALLGIANTLALSIHERTRELGLLRAVGMTRRQLRTSVRWESVIIALLGAALGLVIGVFFGWILVHAASNQGITQFRIPFGQLAFVTVIAALAGVVAAIGPARRAARLDVLTAIATE